MKQLDTMFSISSKQDIFWNTILPRTGLILSNVYVDMCHLKQATFFFHENIIFKMPSSDIQRTAGLVDNVCFPTNIDSCCRKWCRKISKRNGEQKQISNFRRIFVRR